MGVAVHSEHVLYPPEYLSRNEATSCIWVAVSTFAPSLPGITPTSISLGASGGIAGLIGLLLMVGRVQGKNVPVGIAHTVRNYAVTVIVLNVVLTFVFGVSLDINNYAHIGGLITGAVITAAYAYAPRSHRFLFQGAATVAVLAILILAVIIRNGQLSGLGGF